MANNIGVRSPRFVTFGGLSDVSHELRVSINGTLRYTLSKNIEGSASFEVSELIRDYINISYNGTMPSSADIVDDATGWCADVSLSWTSWDDLERTGPGSGSGISLVAYDAYKFFSETGYNYSFPSSDVLLTSRTIWLPENTAGAFYYTNSTVITKYDIGTSTTGTVTPVGSETVTIRRFNCTSHDPIKLVFINRFGMPQELWFFGRTTASTSVESEQYKSSNISANGSYNIYEHQFKKLDVRSKTKYTLNTGFVTEDYNDSITELMMSEQVWMHVDGTVRPINVASTDVTYRTSLNDKLVEYTIEVEQANDLISTMR
jgi:hypothetical protein